MIGIIGAMEVEVANIRGAMKDMTVTKVAGMEFCKGRLGDSEHVVVQCGIGKVNAGICVQILCDLYHVDRIINTGVAGSLDNDINIGDIVISTDAIQHDMDVSPLGYALGQIPGSPYLAFPADETMRNAVHTYLDSEKRTFGVFEGRVLSGDQFIAGNEKKEWLVEHFAGRCAEMEGASIAQAATNNAVPFLILRAISDKADGSAEMDYPTFEAETAKKMSDLLIELVEKQII